MAQTSVGRAHEPDTAVMAQRSGIISNSNAAKHLIKGMKLTSWVQCLRGGYPVVIQKGRGSTPHAPIKWIRQATQTDVSTHRCYYNLSRVNSERATISDT